MTAITKIRAREVLDSRGRPTVEADVWIGASLGRAIVPSGASKGATEAVELRDGDSERYDGAGVLHAVANVNEILAPALLGIDAADQSAVDAAMTALDDSPRKFRLGANATLAVSMAAARAAAVALGIPLYRHLQRSFCAAAGGSRFPAADGELRLPLPMTNLISGGLHAGGNLDIQDVLVMPHGAASYSEGLEWIVRVYRRLGALLDGSGYEGRLVGDEGGYGPRLASNRQAVELVVAAIEAAGLTPGADVSIALDVAATHFWRNGRYELAAERGRLLDSGQMIDRLDEWSRDFPIASIEDGLAEEDWEGWVELTQRLGERVKLVGDDLFTTNVERVQRGVELGAANALLVKVNQIGTLSETFAAMHTARKAGYALVVSARSGETEDATIADLAVAAGAETIKIGSIVRSERLAKYNQLLRIEEEIGGAMSGWDFRGYTTRS